MRYEQTWDILAEVLGEIVYTRDPIPPRLGGRFSLSRDDENNYAVLFIFTYNQNTYHPDEMRHTRHEFVVPVATYNKDTWRRWVHDKIQSIEAHETTECFFVNGVRIYSPHHGQGEDPYIHWYDGHPDKQALPPG